MSHPQEPWTWQPNRIDSEDGAYDIYCADNPDEYIASVWTHTLMTGVPINPKETCERIVACINFCAGTDGDFLTGAGNLGKMLSGTGIAELTAQRDQLLAACRDLLLSADAMWEEKNMGHDWREACDAARALIRSVRATNTPNQEEPK